MQYLDELVLRLSHRTSQQEWLHNEVQKMVKLVESQDAGRAIPIVSLVARQRNLAEMVGKMHTGMEHQLLYDSLNHWEGRFDKIDLEDSDLPAIIETRPEAKERGGARRAATSLRAPAQQRGRARRTPRRSWGCAIRDTLSSRSRSAPNTSTSSSLASPSWSLPKKGAFPSTESFAPSSAAPWARSFSETHDIKAEEALLQPLENKRMQKGADPPQVSDVRDWIDEGLKMLARRRAGSRRALLRGLG